MSFTFSRKDEDGKRDVTMYFLLSKFKTCEETTGMQVL